ncbi:MAG: DUF3153 domain-containing protein [Xenococcaceae cyanobacterium MO_207.B15]|nr:DUF3153 domain-containing protein [Xenococcaceae cyanobacterium MO_207.B15]
MNKKLLLSLILSLVTMLTGCVRYDVGINFQNPQNGTIVQHIAVEKQLANLSPKETKQWLQSIETRSQLLQGKVKKISSQELLVTIPFNSGTELVSKFNQFFYNKAYSNYSDTSAKNSKLGQLDSQIALKQSNLIFVERNTLDLTIDLRGLESLSHQGKVAMDPESLVDLEFHLDTPSFARSVSGKNNLKATKIPQGLVWELEPGKINHIKAIFWLPSPVGIGTGIIILLMIGGFVIKYRRFPGIA